MAGSFGYELDLNRLPEEEKEQVIQQVEDYKKYYDLIHEGDYYRLQAPGKGNFTAWSFVSRDRSRVLFNLVMTHARANDKAVHVRFRGLDENRRYRLPANEAMPGPVKADRVLTGAALIHAGLTLQPAGGEYRAVQFELTAED